MVDRQKCDHLPGTQYVLTDYQLQLVTEYKLNPTSELDDNESPLLV